MIRTLVELSDEINGRKHSYLCPTDAPCEEVIAYCKCVIEYCEKKLEEAKTAEKVAEKAKPIQPEEVKDVGCCSI